MESTKEMIALSSVQGFMRKRYIFLFFFLFLACLSLWIGLRYTNRSLRIDLDQPSQTQSATSEFHTGTSGSSQSEAAEVDQKKPVVIIYWTTFYSEMAPVNHNPFKCPFFYAGTNCPVECVLTTDKNRLDEATAIVIHGANAGERPSERGNKTWILHTNEQIKHSPVLGDSNVMAMFNYLISYRLDADFLATEFLKPSLEKPIPFKEKRGLIIVALSNCEPVRTRYIAELMKHIQVDSYGGCLQNKKTLSGRRSQGAFRDVRELQRKYKFSLAFPNADCDYYMTEKLGNALSAGSVPVWMGTDKIDVILQWGNLKHSVIKVSDFPTPKKLAEYLKSLAENESEYNKYLKWKYEGFQFPKEYYKSPIGVWWEGLPLYCRVCMKLAKDPKGHNGLPVDRCDGNQTRTFKKWSLE